MASHTWFWFVRSRPFRSARTIPGSLDDRMGQDIRLGRPVNRLDSAAPRVAAPLDNLPHEAMRLTQEADFRVVQTIDWEGAHSGETLMHSRLSITVQPG